MLALEEVVPHLFFDHLSRLVPSYPRPYDVHYGRLPPSVECVPQRIGIYKTFASALTVLEICSASLRFVRSSSDTIYSGGPSTGSKGTANATASPARFLINSIIFSHWMTLLWGNCVQVYSSRPCYCRQRKDLAHTRNMVSCFK